MQTASERWATLIIAPDWDPLTSHGELKFGYLALRPISVQLNPQENCLCPLFRCFKDRLISLSLFG